MIIPHRASALLALVLAAVCAPCLPGADDVTLLNASYDVTREFYRDVNPAFAAVWLAKTGQKVDVHQSHAGSSKQARAVIDGLQADVVTMNQTLDIDAIAEKGGQVPADWAKRLPNGAVPYTSTILFLVRKGNPKGIAGWDDLIKPGVAVIIPNPKTSGNGRYSYLAAWAHALRAAGGDEAKARQFITKLFANVPVLDTGGRGATVTFAQRGIGDVLLTFENEIGLIAQEQPGEGFVTVVPALSIQADNPVAVVERVAAKHGTTAVAQAYLEFLFSDAGQELAAKHGFRPITPAILVSHAARFPALQLVTVAQVFGSWKQAQQVHFSEGGVFDQIYQPH